MCRSAVIAKMVNLAQEKSPANKVCRDLRDGGRKIGFGEEFRGRLGRIFPSLCSNLSTTSRHVFEKLIYLSSVSQSGYLIPWSTAIWNK